MDKRKLIDIEKEFVPYDLALILKELGFNEKCFMHVSWTGSLFLCNGDYAIYETKNSEYKKIKYNFTEPKNYETIQIPTFSQSFRWFRDKYNLLISPRRTLDEKTWYYFQIEVGNQIVISSGSFYYEQAELECLKKLIEICKKN